jgi:hypothetical protein
MKTVLLLVAIAALAIGIALYRARSSSQLNVEPHAAEEIEKAKRR